MTGPHKMALGGILLLLFLSALFVWIVAESPFPAADLVRGR